MTSENGKFFSIISNKNYQNFIYNVEKYKGGKYSLERIEYSDEILGSKQYKRTFFLKNLLPEGNDLLVVTINDNKISISRYILENNILKVQKNITNVSYEVLATNDYSEIEFQYVEDMKKSVCVFDINKKIEVIPACYYNSREKIIKGRFKLQANNKYIILKLGKKENEQSA